MDALLDALFEWIGRHSAYDVARVSAPAVHMMTPEELTFEIYGSSSGTMALDIARQRVRGFYSAQEGPHGTVYILSPEYFADADAYEAAADNPLFLEVMVHELVHHLQYATHADAGWRCPGFGEYEAYKLGGIYLFQQGVEDPLPARMFIAGVHAGC